MTDKESPNFKKWQEVHKILNGWGFKIVFEIDGKFLYLANGYFEGYIYYNIEKDLFRLRDVDDELLEELQGDHLNLFMLKQTLIEWAR